MHLLFASWGMIVEILLHCEPTSLTVSEVMVVANQTLPAGCLEPLDVVHVLGDSNNRYSLQSEAVVLLSRSSLTSVWSIGADVDLTVADRKSVV